MYRIILLLFIFISQSVFAGLCFEVDKVKFKLDKVKGNTQGKYLLEKQGSKFSNYYFCTEHKGVLNCIGDDDAGEFDINKSKITMKSQLNFGGPDGPSDTLKQKSKSFQLKKCP